MKDVFHDDGFLIVDNFLPAKEFLAIQKFIQFQDYQSVHARGWSKSWRPSDGNPLVSQSFFSKDLPGVLDGAAYPSGTGIDFVIKRILASIKDYSRWTGAEDVWEYFNASVYLYPQGTGLGWHEDDYSYSGAYIYYAHPEWRPGWGGELCVMGYTEPSSGLAADEPEDIAEIYAMAGVTGGDYGPEFGQTLRDKKIMEQGHGTFIIPKPNRMIFIREGYSHCIKKVDPSAGDRMRCSIAGFFVKKTPS